MEQEILTLNDNILISSWSNWRLHSYKRLLCTAAPPPTPTLLGLYWTPLTNEHHLSNRRYLMTITPEYSTRKSDREKNSSINWYSVSCLINMRLHILFNNLLPWKTRFLILLMYSIRQQLSPGRKTWDDGTVSPFRFSPSHQPSLSLQSCMLSK